jgi:hypothetical protein
MRISLSPLEALWRCSVSTKLAVWTSRSCIQYLRRHIHSHTRLCKKKTPPPPSLGLTGTGVPGRENYGKMDWQRRPSPLATSFNRTSLIWTSIRRVKSWVLFTSHRMRSRPCSLAMLQSLQRAWISTGPRPWYQSCPHWGVLWYVKILRVWL